jgi:hypothetical protein
MLDNQIKTNNITFSTYEKFENIIDDIKKSTSKKENQENQYQSQKIFG